MVTVNWEPYYGESLKEGGVISDIVMSAFEQVGHKAKVAFVPWRRALKLVKDGQRDVVMGAYFSKERDKIYVYSQSIYEVEVGLISKKPDGIDRYNDLTDLASYSIGVQRDYVNSEAFDAADFLNKDIAKSAAINIKKLERGRIDMLAAAFGIFRYELNLSGGNDIDFNFIQPLLSQQSLYIMASREIADAKSIVADFNRGLAMLKKQGLYDKILKSHGF